MEVNPNATMEPCEGRRTNCVFMEINLPRQEDKRNASSADDQVDKDEEIEQLENARLTTADSDDGDKNEANEGDEEADDDDADEAGPSYHRKLQVTFQLPLPGDNNSYETEHCTNRSVERHHERIIHSPINPILHTLPANDSIQQPTFVADKPITNEVKLASHDDPAEARRIRCKYCQEFFNDEFNRHCKYAPDCYKNALECMTLMKCARCMLYHCDISDPEGEMPQHPCECIPGESCFSKRWLGLCVLSFLLPCLCLYPPCYGCHRIGIACGCCGRKHQV